MMLMKAIQQQDLILNYNFNSEIRITVISKESMTEKSLCIKETDFSPSEEGFDTTSIIVCDGSEIL